MLLLPRQLLLERRPAGLPKQLILISVLTFLRKSLLQGLCSSRIIHPESNIHGMSSISGTDVTGKQNHYSFCLCMMFMAQLIMGHDIPVPIRRRRHLPSRKKGANKKKTTTTSADPRTNHSKETNGMLDRCE